MAEENVEKPVETPVETPVAGGNEGGAPDETLIGAENQGKSEGETTKEQGNSSLIGGDEGLNPQNGELSEGQSDTGSETPLTKDAFLASLAFSEDLGKDEKGEALKPNKEFLEPFVPVFQKLGLKPEQAGELVTAYAKIERDALAKAEEAAKKAQAEADAAWKKQRTELRAQAVKELSQEDLVYANRAMDSLKKDDPTFYKAVQQSVLGVHPAFLKLCAMAGRRVADDSLPKPAGVGGGAQKTRGQILFAEEIRAGNAR